MKADELQDIVLLCSSLPRQKTFELINMFPKVYFILVNNSVRCLVGGVTHCNVSTGKLSATGRSSACWRQESKTDRCHEVALYM